jgi:O-6-methylguanine DNA methyltransferase
MVYSVDLYGIWLTVFIEGGIIVKTAFSDKSIGIKSNDLRNDFNAFIHGDKEALKFSFGDMDEKRKKVYLKTMEIPCGFVSSYGGISLSVFGNKKYARFVGHAMGVNHLPIIVPCHRVVASDGKIGGFSSPIEIKLTLLSIEKVKIINGKIGKTFFTDI